jgi:phage gp36-like protein
MSVYADPSDVRLALSPGGDEADTGSAASLSDEDLNAALDDAMEEIDGKIRGRYSLPFTDVPPIVARVATDLAAFFATLTYRRGDPIQPGDPVLLRYNAAEALLTQIQKGMIDLDDTAVLAQGGQPVVANVLTGNLFDTDDFPVPPAFPVLTTPGFRHWPF